MVPAARRDPDAWGSHRRPIGSSRCLLDATLMRGEAIGEQLEVADAEHAQLGAGVVARAWRNGIGGPLGSDDHQVAERARFFEDARECGLDILADFGVTRELLDLVDND